MLHHTTHDLLFKLDQNDPFFRHLPSRLIFSEQSHERLLATSRAWLGYRRLAI